ncbi:hypothetical protein K492DRAFT_77243 [Lichtheimia hyalospora FSU 10163]|nr:hypothetical protein K492DRAFT_77243 [Lichtheimia hyalospora FSU 10163]
MYQGSCLDSSLLLSSTNNQLSTDSKSSSNLVNGSKLNDCATLIGFIVPSFSSSLLFSLLISLASVDLVVAVTPFPWVFASANEE